MCATGHVCSGSVTCVPGHHWCNVPMVLCLPCVCLRAHIVCHDCHLWAVIVFLSGMSGVTGLLLNARMNGPVAKLE